MKLKPVRKIHYPQYPDKAQVRQDKTLLSQRPYSWHSQPLLATACTLLLVTALPGCRSSDYDIIMGELPYSSYQLTDEDALAVIATELAKAGYQLTVPGKDTGGFSFDGLVTVGKQRINLEYVSDYDYHNMKYPDLLYETDDVDYIRTLANQLREEYEDVYVLQAPPDYESETELRAQIADFILWLQANNQGN